MTKYGEPWAYLPNGVLGERGLVGDICRPRSDGVPFPFIADVPEEDARRIVACVNACAGIRPHDLRHVIVDIRSDPADGPAPRYLMSGDREECIKSAVRLLRDNGYAVTEPTAKGPNE